MGDHWYCLILGEEFGPISWDDLMGMASRGMLNRKEKVRRGSDADWVEAESIDGLFFATPRQTTALDDLDESGLRQGSAWLCRFLGEELGPFTWAELLEMAQRGRLTRTQSVRQVGEPNWCRAEQVQGLFVGPLRDNDTDFDVAIASPAQPTVAGLPSDDADFELATPLVQNSTDVRVTADELEFDLSQPDAPRVEAANSTSDDADFEVAAPMPARSRDETSFELAAIPARIAEGEKEASDADFEVDASSHITAAPSDDDFEIAPLMQTAPATDVEIDAQPEAVLAQDKRPDEGKPSAAETAEPNASPDESALAAKDAAEGAPPKVAESPPSAPAVPDTKAAKAKKKKKPEKRPRAKTASAGLSDESKRAMFGTIGIASLAGLAYVAYLGIMAFASMRSADYDKVLAGYDQLYQQAKQAQVDVNVSSDPKAAAQFLAALNELRGPLRSAQPDSPDAQLYEAGTMLVELFAAAAATPRTEAAKDREETDKKYLSTIASIRTKLGHYK